MEDAKSTERQELAAALYQLQVYGQSQAEVRGIRYEDIPDLVEKALANPDPQALADARLICSQMVAPYIVDEPGVEEMSLTEMLVRARANGFGIEVEYPGLGESLGQMLRGEGRKVRSSSEQHV